MEATELRGRACPVVSLACDYCLCITFGKWRWFKQPKRLNNVFTDKRFAPWWPNVTTRKAESLLQNKENDRMNWDENKPTSPGLWSSVFFFLMQNLINNPARSLIKKRRALLKRPSFDELLNLWTITIIKNNANNNAGRFQICSAAQKRWAAMTKAGSYCGAGGQGAAEVRCTEMSLKVLN